MSFGDGNLHEEVDRLKDVNGKLCDEINRQERRIRELESLVGVMPLCWDADCDRCPYSVGNCCTADEAWLALGLGPR